jgi:hypothetical protein
MAAFRGSGAGVFVPETAIGKQPLQNLEMTTFRGISADILIPVTAVFSRPL